MSMSPPPSRYSSAAIFLHWTLALLLMFQLSLGWRLVGLAGLPQFVAYQLHKTIGLSILLLSLARLALRLMVRRPAPARMSPPLAFLAGAVHALLYVVMIGGPITGWILVSTAKVKVQTMFFGVIHWPHLPLGAGWHDPAEGAHALLAWLLLGLVVLHVAGALRRHLMRDDILARMMPRAIRGRGTHGLLAGVAILAILGVMAAAQFMTFSPKPSAAPVDEPSNAANAANAMNEADNVVNAAAASEPQVGNATVNEAATDDAAKAAVPWRIQSGGQLGFKADYSGSAVDGAFKRWDGDILFSPDDLPNSRISVTIDLASVDTADSQRDDTLRSDGFFDVATHPKATFRSTRITHRGGKAYRAAGTLSLHGQQRPVTVDFTLDIKGDDATVAGTAPLSRTAFGVGTGEWADTGTIKDAVGVTFRFKAKRSN